VATYDPALLDALEELPTAPWSGPVWRHMFNDYPPDRVNTSGARWNPPGVGAVYTAMARETALAEGQHAIDVQPTRLYARRVLYEIEVAVSDVVDLSDSSSLREVGLTLADVAADDHTACQRVGGAAAWLGRGGLIVPSARDVGMNLVILVGGGLGLDDDVVVLREEVIDDRRPN
jgi:RES domain-containing protein